MIIRVYIDASTTRITVKHNQNHGITTTRITVLPQPESRYLITTGISVVTIENTVIYQKQSLVVKENNCSK